MAFYVSPGGQSVLSTPRCRLRKSRPSDVRATTSMPPSPSRSSTYLRSVASSQTGSRGHEVRHASMTSAYDLGWGAIHSRRSRIKACTGSLKIDFRLSPWPAAICGRPLRLGAQLRGPAAAGQRPRKTLRRQTAGRHDAAPLGRDRCSTLLYGDSHFAKTTTRNGEIPPKVLRLEIRMIRPAEDMAQRDAHAHRNERV